MKRLLCLLLAVLFAASVITGCAAKEAGTGVTSSGADTYAAWLDSRLEKTDGAVKRSITVARADSGCGVDLSSFNEDGFYIRANATDAVILARTDEGLDRAVRRYAISYATVPGEFAYADGDGPRVGRITLSGADVSEYVILLPAADTGDTAFGAAATENMKYCAEILTKYVKKECGVALPTEYVTGLSHMSDGEIRAAYPHAIAILADPTATGDNPFTTGELGCESYDISLERGLYKIVAGNMRGAMYAAYDVLEDKLGWRFLTSDVTYVYEADEVSVADYTKHVTPTYDYRYSSHVGKTNTCFDALRHNGHESFSVLNSDKYGWSLGTTWYHAHSFEYQVEGCTAQDQPCLSDPDVLEEVIESMTDLLNERIGWGQRIGYELTQISCSMNDNTNFCSCRDCNTARVKIGFTELYMKFVNAAADAMAERFPGIMVYSICYNRTRTPPTVNVPRDNVIMHYCVQGCNNHPMGSLECANHPRTTLGYNNVTEKENIEAWAAVTKHLYIWAYSTTFNGHLFPSPNVYEIYDEMKYYATLGAEGFYAEGDYTASYCFEELKSYLYYRMMWNSDITEDEFYNLIDEYLMIVYGDAAPYMKEYLDLYQTAGDLVGCFTNNYSLEFDELDRDYFAQHYEYMRELMAKATEHAPDLATEQKIERFTAHVDFLGLQATYLTNWLHGTAEQKAEYQARYSNILRIMRKYGMFAGRTPEEYPLPDTDEVTSHPVEMIYGFDIDAKEKGREIDLTK